MSAKRGPDSSRTQTADGYLAFGWYSDFILGENKAAAVVHIVVVFVHDVNDKTHFYELSPSSPSFEEEGRL